MSNPNLGELLKNFNNKQLKEINDFLNSGKGKSFKNSLSDYEKKKLLDQFSRLDPSSVKKTMSSMSTEDIINALNKFRR